MLWWWLFSYFLYELYVKGKRVKKEKKEHKRQACACVFVCIIGEQNAHIDYLKREKKNSFFFVVFEGEKDRTLT